MQLVSGLKGAMFGQNVGHSVGQTVERRTARRASARLFCNQYIDGTPLLGEAVELSMTGALLRRINGPDVERACYAIEMGHQTDRVWLCATPVWRRGEYEAVRFIGQAPHDRLRLAHLVRTCG